MTADGTAELLARSLADAGAETDLARAKINLALHVLGRRADGYHELDSLVVFAALADTLTASPSAEPLVELDCDGDFADMLAAATPPGGNLVSAVARHLMQAFPDRIRGGVRLHLTKVLPVAAGIGGGSADAAAALRLLDRVWRLGLSPAELARLGAGFGADVPVCVHGRPSRMEGIGERVTPLEAIPALPMVLLNPGVAVDTGAVFRRLAPAPRAPLPPMPSRFASPAKLASWLREARNDLYEPARLEAPVIGTALDRLAADPACLLARMSGSGATVFGLFPAVEAAQRAAARIRDARPDWWVVATWTGGS